MGPLESILGMLPGMGNIKQAMGAVDEKQLVHIEAIINSMTPDERHNHALINGSRRKRIARGSGRSVEEINRLLKQFVQMKKMLKVVGGMSGGGGGKAGMRKRMGMLQQMMGSAGAYRLRRTGARPRPIAVAKPKVEYRMVTIRLTRMGSKKRPFFRVVVVEGKSARDGSFVESLGYYNPRKSPEFLTLDRERSGVLGEQGRAAVEHAADARGAEPRAGAPRSRRPRERRPSSRRRRERRGVRSRGRRARRRRDRRQPAGARRGRRADAGRRARSGDGHRDRCTAASRSSS